MVNDSTILPPSFNVDKPNIVEANKSGKTMYTSKYGLNLLVYS